MKNAMRVCFVYLITMQKISSNFIINQLQPMEYPFNEVNSLESIYIYIFFIVLYLKNNPVL